MAHDPKLNVYTIQLKASNNSPYNNNRWLFRHKINQANTTPLTEGFIMAEIFAKVIQQLDAPEMYADDVNKKCMTANQPNINDNNVNPNIILHSEQKIIEGKIEGGTYGRKRNKTSTINKAEKSRVQERDAITEDFYFLLYTPFNSSKSVLMIQSFTDDTIDSVMKKFWQNFFSFPTDFNHPKIERYIPNSIINDIKNNSTISSLSFTTEVLGQTLLEDPIIQEDHEFVVKVEIKPLRNELTVEEYTGIIDRIIHKVQRFLPQNAFNRRTGTLRDRATDRNSQFEIGTDFDIHPTIYLSKHIELTGQESDFDRIRDFCFRLLEEIKTEIYPQHAVQER